MAIEPEEPQAVVEEEEQEGGPVKSFLEHLEDLRWTLIKSIVAAAVAMLICLLGGNYVVNVIERPLFKAKMKYPKGVQVWAVFFGTNQIASFQIHTNQVPSLPFGTNPFVGLQLEPVVESNDVVLRLKVDTNASAAAGQRLPIQLINLGPAGAFVIATKVAFYAGLVLAAPVHHAHRRHPEPPQLAGGVDRRIAAAYHQRRADLGEPEPGLELHALDPHRGADHAGTILFRDAELRVGP